MTGLNPMIALLRCGKFGRPFSTLQKFTNYALAEYKKDSNGVDRVMDHIIKNNKFVLFLEGTVDKPASLCAMNIVLPLVTIDILAEPACYGYLSTKLNDTPTSVLVANGKTIVNHDEMLEHFKNGNLLQVLNHQKRSVDSSPLDKYLPISNI